HRERCIHRLDEQRRGEIIRPNGVDVFVESREPRVRRAFPQSAIPDLQGVSSEMTSRCIDGIHQINVLVMAAIDGRNRWASALQPSRLVSSWQLIDARHSWKLPSEFAESYFESRARR